mmetsp:Transcript_141166/g.245807  ORF Transcript_141166/g.245807 Transcript_141166/m.245807 type:complete len:108 (-) Transcript_141166:912-1235(-)
MSARGSHGRDYAKRSPVALKPAHMLANGLVAANSGTEAATTLSQADLTASSHQRKLCPRRGSAKLNPRGSAKLNPGSSASGQQKDSRVWASFTTPPPRPHRWVGSSR